jgi:hypothetical protein
MPRKAKILTIKEFASLRAVGDSEISGRPAPVISAEHGARLIALGYMIQFCGADDDAGQKADRGRRS